MSVCERRVDKERSIVGGKPLCVFHLCVSIWKEKQKHLHGETKANTSHTEAAQFDFNDSFYPMFDSLQLMRRG